MTLIYSLNDSIFDLYFNASDINEIPIELFYLMTSSADKSHLTLQSLHDFTVFLKLKYVSIEQDH